MFGLATNFPVEFRRLVFILRLEAKKSHKISRVSRAQWDVVAEDRVTSGTVTGERETSLAAVAGLGGRGVFFSCGPWGLAGLHTALADHGYKNSCPSTVPWT